MGSIKDTSIKIKPSEKLQAFLQELDEGDDIPVAIDALRSKDKTEGETFLGIEDLKWVRHYLKNSDRKYHFHELLNGSCITLPEPEVIPRSPVLEARIQRLKLEQEERDYKKMTKNVDPVRVYEPEDSISYQLKQINRQLIAVLQFVFSVAAGFAFGFIGVELLIGGLEFGFRLLLGVICALIIALAEIYFLAKKLSEDIFPSDTKVHQD